MMVFAGAYSRTRGTSIPAALGAELRGALSRFPGERVVAREQPGCLLLSTMPLAEQQGRVAAVAGRPLLVQGGRALADEEAGRGLAAALPEPDLSVLLACRGTFAAAGYDAERHRLALAADRLGAWPLYWHVGDEVVTFASALRVLEHCPSLRLAVDFRGAIESASFGYPIGERSPYARTYRARSAELACFDGATMDRRLYFDWSSCGGTLPVDRDSLAELYRLFQEAIALRLPGTGVVRAFLSGGLDSRCIVAELARHTPRPITYNMSWEGSLDRTIGRQVAERLGTDHREFALPLDAGGSAWPRMTGEILRQEREAGDGAEAAPVVWAGEGGSVPVGRVLVGAAMLAPLRRGDLPGCVAAFQAEHRVGAPRWSLTRGVRAEVQLIPSQAIRGELLAVHPAEPGQRLMLFLVRNDQRGHAAGYFENLDLNRVEYRFPFYDAEFLRHCLSLRLDECIGHRMYNRWTECFPPVVRELPWQSYPGHEPSPVALDARARAQWDMIEQTVRATRRKGLERPRALARSEAFPREVVDRARYRVQLELHHRGVRDYSYLFEFVSQLERYWRTAGGRWV